MTATKFIFPKCVWQYLINVETCSKYIVGVVIIQPSIFDVSLSISMDKYEFPPFVLVGKGPATSVSMVCPGLGACRVLPDAPVRGCLVALFSIQSLQNIGLFGIGIPYSLATSSKFLCPRDLCRLMSTSSFE